jgi:hypothetical protein
MPGVWRSVCSAQITWNTFASARRAARCYVHPTVTEGLQLCGWLPALEVAVSCDGWFVLVFTLSMLVALPSLQVHQPHVPPGVSMAPHRSSLC